MLPYLLLTLAAAVATPTSDAQASPTSNLPNPPRRLEALSGRCEHFVFAGADQTAHCRALLTSMYYARGRSMQFWTEDPKRAISFFGIPQASGHGTRLSLEMITVVEGAGDEPTTRKARASGSCQIGDAAAGPARVTCEAVVDGEAYKGTFLTDGNPPKGSDFPK
jgi:hypothetical protein